MFNDTIQTPYDMCTTDTFNGEKQKLWLWDQNITMLPILITLNEYSVHQKDMNKKNKDVEIKEANWNCDYLW